MHNKTILELTEYTPQSFPEAAIPPGVGEILWGTYAAQVHVEPPTFLNGEQWVLAPRGWVGFIPLTADMSLYLRPRVPLTNVFGMLEVAYRLKSFRFLDGTMPCASLTEFYERLAHVLAQRVLDRARRGLHRAYVIHEATLPYVTGRLEVQHLARRPWTPRFCCQYEEHTVDNLDNQILAWTLRHILRSGQCTERALPALRRAYRVLHSTVSLTPIRVQDCVGRLYHRLNQDYAPLHGLCRFFLEHTGPEHTLGHRAVMPFLVNMPRLYELFVAEWLRQHLPPTLRLEAQERVTFGAAHRLTFDIDLTIYDAVTQRARCVLDTKYKVPDAPATEDVSQVVTYAEIKGCQDAVLVYPVQVNHPLDETLGDIRVRSLTFATAGDLDVAGTAFLDKLDGLNEDTPSKV